MKNPFKALWLGITTLTGAAAESCLEPLDAANWVFHGVTADNNWRLRGSTPDNQWPQQMLRGTGQQLITSTFTGAHWREDYSNVGYIQCHYVLQNADNKQLESFSIQYRRIMNDNSLTDWHADGKFRVCQADDVSKCSFDLYAAPPSMAPKASPTLHQGNEHREIFSKLMPEEVAGLLRLSLISDKVAKVLTLNYDHAFETRAQANDCFTLWGKAHAKHLIINHKMPQTRVMDAKQAKKCHQFMRNLHNHVQPAATECTVGDFGEVTCLRT